MTTDTIGSTLKKARERKAMSLAEVSRVTRIPITTIESIEQDRFDDLPGEVFVRGFLKSFAQSVGLQGDEIVARYTSSRRIVLVTPLPTATAVEPVRTDRRRFGVAIAFVLLLILFTLALSIVLKPRGHDMPSELSRTSSSSTQRLV